MVHPAGQPDPAPALTRGLRLLQLLQREGTCSLEQLVRASGFPKSSVARLMTALVGCGAADRDAATLRYRALLHLLPPKVDDQRLMQLATPLLTRVGCATNQAVELHRWAGGVLEMIDRQEPADAVVQAVARVGWQRSLDELDALTQVVRAFADLPPAAQMWYWSSGRQYPVSVRRLTQQLTTVRQQHSAMDLGINEHGVRRYAAPVLHQERLVAVIAIAQACTPHAAQEHAPWRELLVQAGRELTDLLDPMATQPAISPSKTRSSHAHSLS